MLHKLGSTGDTGMAAGELGSLARAPAGDRPASCRHEVGAAVFGVSLGLESECREFADFVARNYHAFLGEVPVCPDVRVRFGQGAGERARSRRKGMRAAGMGLYFDDRALFWENEFGFAILVEPDAAGGFGIHAYHFDLDRESDPDLRARNLQRSMRWALHFPVFSLLSERYDLRLVHASAVARDSGRALVFCGLNKVGKSTLSAFLARREGYSFMTDNFLLAGPEAVFGFPETLRLGPESLGQLGVQATGSTIYGKHHLALPPDGIRLKGDPAACFFVTNGAKLEATPMDAGRASSLIAGLDDYLGEFPRHSFMAALPLLPAVSMRPVAASDPVLRRRPWYRLSLPKDWRLGDAKELVEACI